LPWPLWLPVSLELTCLLVIGCELAARVLFTGWREFRREWWTYSRAIVVAATLADLGTGALLWVGWRHSGLTRVARIFVFMTQHHSLRMACVNTLRTVPALTEVLLMLNGY
jgi:hypothetical protein